MASRSSKARNRTRMENLLGSWIPTATSSSFGNRCCGTRRIRREHRNPSANDPQMIRFETEVYMITTATKTRLTSFAPQFLVDDLGRSIGFYEKLGFKFGEPWEGFYAIGNLDGF